MGWIRFTWNAGVTAQKGFYPMRLSAIKDLDNPDRRTDKAIRALQSAIDCAGEHHHRYVTPEHLLLALARMELNFARENLEKLGVQLTSELGAVVSLVAVIAPETQEGEPSASPMMDRLLESAKGAAVELRHNWVGTEHLLLGMLAFQESAAGEFLARRGVTPQKIREAIQEFLGHPQRPT